MEFGSIEQSIFINATPEVVYETVSSPQHIAGWFVDEAEYVAAPGNSGYLGFGAPGERFFLPLTVIDAIPGVRFSFRWMAPPNREIPAVGTTLTDSNSIVVTFDIVPSGAGSILKVTESGMRELGWDAALLEHYYNDHSDGWTSLLGKLAAYVNSMPVGS